MIILHILRRIIGNFKGEWGAKVKSFRGKYELKLKFPEG